MPQFQMLDRAWSLVLLGLASLGGLLVLVIRSTVEAAVERVVEREFRKWEIRFATLHGKRVDVMEGVQDRLANLYAALESATGLHAPGDDNAVRRELQQATEVANELRRFLRSRRFYLPKSLAQRIDEVLKEMQSAWASLSTSQDAPLLATDAGDAIRAQMWSRGYEKVRKELPDVLAEVEAKFRAIVEGEGDRA